MKYSEEILEMHRDINVDHTEWWRDVEDMFIEDMAELGIDVSDIQFSGFYSQGDGACFSGYVCDVDKFMKAMGSSWDDYPRTLDVLKQLGEDIHISWKHSKSNYYHENTLSFDIEYDRLVDELSWDSPQLLLDAAEALDAAADAEYRVLEHDITSFVKGLCIDLYERLQDSYEHLTSDEAVAATIDANELYEDCA